jgi:hypothetical protein
MTNTQVLSKDLKLFVTSKDLLGHLCYHACLPTLLLLLLVVLSDDGHTPAILATIVITDTAINCNIPQHTAHAGR